MREKKDAEQTTTQKTQNFLSSPTGCVFLSCMVGGLISYLFIYNGRTVNGPARSASMRYGRASGGERPWLHLLFILSILSPPSSRPYLQGGHPRRHRLRTGVHARQEGLE